MAKRHKGNKEYASISKCSSPFCTLSCCGNAFGVRRRTSSGRVKRATRRYFRHATKQDWRKEFDYESVRAEQDILIICGFDEDYSDVLAYSAEYGNGY